MRAGFLFEVRALASKLFNLVRVTSPTIGTGTMTLGSVIGGYLTFALAGITNGDVVDYCILDGSAGEIGTGAYSSTGPTLTRSVTKSTNANALLSLTGAQQIGIWPRAETIADASRFTTGSLALARMTLLLSAQNQFTAQQTYTLATLTDGATINWDVSTRQKAIVTLGGNRTFAAVTNAVEGTTYYLYIAQDATGSRLPTFTTTGAGSFDFGTAGAPTFTTTVSKVDLVCFEALTIAGTLKLRYCGIQKGFS